MKIAIISDIHSNIEALEEVIADINRRGVDKVVCLGDIVGYGANPKECIKRIKSLTSNVIAGNHDYGVGGLTPINYFSSVAKSAVKWTKKQLNRSELNFLRLLPLTINWGSVLFIHSSPDAPDMWNYILTSSDAIVQFRFFSEAILFVGHTHIPGIWNESGSFSVPTPKPFRLDTKKRYIVNPGSVGQPRDGVNDASYLIFDSDYWSIDFIRVKYDIETASAKIKAAELPLILSERIKYGQ